MTLPQRNTALARPTNFYYLMCKLDRAQYHEHQSNKLHQLQKQNQTLQRENLLLKIQLDASKKLQALRKYPTKKSRK